MSSSATFPASAAIRRRVFAPSPEKSNEALDALGNDIQWQETFVTGDKTYCVYLAASEELIREHARTSGFPANRISEVVTVIDPSTAALQGAAPRVERAQAA
jgi:hypothetical protein